MAKMVVGTPTSCAALHWLPPLRALALHTSGFCLVPLRCMQGNLRGAHASMPSCKTGPPTVSNGPPLCVCVCVQVSVLTMAWRQVACLW